MATVDQIQASECCATACPTIGVLVPKTVPFTAQGRLLCLECATAGGLFAAFRLPFAAIADCVVVSAGRPRTMNARCDTAFRRLSPPFAAFHRGTAAVRCDRSPRPVGLPDGQQLRHLPQLRPAGRRSPARPPDQRRPRAVCDRAAVALQPRECAWSVSLPFAAFPRR